MIVTALVIPILLVTGYMIQYKPAEVQNIAEIERRTVPSVTTTVEESVEKTPIKAMIEVDEVEAEASSEGWVSLGTYTVTAYCGEDYPHICNNGDATRTATGATPQANHTIAVDPRQIPFGSELMIDGVVYVAEDCGGAIKQKRVDIFFDTHEQALNYGTKRKEVFIWR